MQAVASQLHEDQQRYNITGQKFGVFGFQGFPLILGIFLCLFRHYKQDRIHIGGFEPGKSP